MLFKQIILILESLTRLASQALAIDTKYLHVLSGIGSNSADAKTPTETGVSCAVLQSILMKNNLPSTVEDKNNAIPDELYAKKGIDVKKRLQCSYQRMPTKRKEGRH